MTRYVRDDVHIDVAQIDGFGKNPGLWVGKENWNVKVASFGNPEKADAFCKWMKYVVGLSDDKSALEFEKKEN